MRYEIHSTGMDGLNEVVGTYTDRLEALQALKKLRAGVKPIERFYRLREVREDGVE